MTKKRRCISCNELFNTQEMKAHLKGVVEGIIIADMVPKK